MKTIKILLATIGVALAGVTVNASAGTATTTITPSLTLSAACSIDTTGLSTTFPAQATGAATTSTLASSNIVVTCVGAAYKLGADSGNNTPSGNVRNLKIGGAGTGIVYTLLADGTLWGNDTMTAANFANGLNTMTAVAATGAAGGETYAITGVATILATSLPGTYTDTVNVALEW